MKSWDEEVREDHQALESQMKALEATFQINVESEDRLVVLRWIVRNLDSSLEPHMRKEEEILFPMLEQLLGEKINVVLMLRRQHKKLRLKIRHLMQLLESSQFVDWDKISLACEGFISLFENHEKTEERLMIDVLELSLKPKEIKALTQFLNQASRSESEEVL